MPYRSKRHVHVSTRPLVVAYLQMAGEPYSLWACRIGRSTDDSTVIVAHDPRDREQQNEAFSRLSNVLLTAIERSLEEDLEPLQLWVTNPGAAANLRRLGRVMRARAVSDEVSLAGAYLDLYAQSADAPGSALCVAATEWLARQRVTGQSDLEDANLATQLVWWDRTSLTQIEPSLIPPSSSAQGVFVTTRIAETMAMGTLLNPVDERSIAALVEGLNTARRDGTHRPELEHTLAEEMAVHLGRIWRALWAAHGQLLAIPEARSADDRWAGDQHTFQLHHDWLQRVGRIRYVDSPMQAARLLSHWEANHVETVRNVALDDDLAFLELVLDNKAIVGTVVSTQPDRKIGRRRRPLVTLVCEPTSVAVDSDLWWRTNPKVRGRVVDVIENPNDATLVVEIVEGVTGAIPAVGDTVGFIALPPPFPIRPKMPTEAPWTHTAAPVDAPIDEDASA